MQTKDVIAVVEETQSKLLDVDGISTEYFLTVETDGLTWVVKFIGQSLFSSEDTEPGFFDVEKRIVEELRAIKDFLSLSLKQFE